MGAKVYLATGIAVIAAIALILSSGVSYFTDTEESYDNTFTAGTTGCCDCILVINTTTWYINYSCDCTSGCICGDLNKSKLEKCVADRKNDGVGTIKHCLEDAGFPKGGANWLAPGHSNGDITTFYPKCCCDWRGDC